MMLLIFYISVLPNEAEGFAPEIIGALQHDINCRCTWKIDILEDDEKEDGQGEDEDGIIKTKYRTEKQLVRIGDPTGSFPPMDRNKFERIKKKFEENGLGIIRDDEEAQKYLDWRSKLEGVFIEAASIGDVIFLRPGASASAVFEEIIHNTQHRQGRVSTDIRNQLQLEIEAAEKLIKYAKAYGLTDRLALLFEEE